MRLVDRIGMKLGFKAQTVMLVVRFVVFSGESAIQVVARIELNPHFGRVDF